MRGFTASAKLALLSAGASICLFAAQTTPQSQPPAGQSRTPAPSKPEAAKPGTAEPSGLPIAVDPKVFSLGPEDVVGVRVWREPDLSGTFVIRPDGVINMPLIREIRAAGLTPEQLAGSITTALSKYVNSPDVTVTVQAVRSKRYYVTGDGIQRPGVYALAVPTTVFEAVALAGGFREFANKKKIIIMRGTKRIKFNYNDIVKGKNLAQNIPLENGDQVIVP